MEMTSAGPGSDPGTGRAAVVRRLREGMAASVLSFPLTSFHEDGSFDADAYQVRAADRVDAGRRRAQAGRYGGAPLYSKRTDRRLGDGAPADIKSVEAATLTQPNARLGPDGVYVSNGTDADGTDADGTDADSGA